MFEIAKPINDEDVIKTNDDFKELNNILGDHEIETKKKILTDKIKQINKDIKDIPIRINQTQQNKQDVPNSIMIDTQLSNKKLSNLKMSV